MFQICLLTLLVTHLSWALEIAIFPKPLARPNEYSVHLAIEGFHRPSHQVRIRRRHGEHEAIEVTPVWEEGVLKDNSVRAGHTYSYDVELFTHRGVLLGRSALAVSVPQDLVLNFEQRLDRTLSGKYGRIFLPARARVYTQGHEVTLRAVELVSPHSRILSFPDQQNHVASADQLNGRAQEGFRLEVVRATGILDLHLHGENGAPGRRGAQGRRGSAGRRGLSSIAPNSNLCTRAPTNGEPGGEGGPGGPGGAGGRGGDIRSVNILVSFKNGFRFSSLLTPGRGGAPGQGGEGGAGGPGGPPGTHTPPCPRAFRGPDGRRGPRGPNGREGRSGQLHYRCFEIGDVRRGNCE